MIKDIIQKVYIEANDLVKNEKTLIEMFNQQFIRGVGKAIERIIWKNTKLFRKSLKRNVQFLFKQIKSEKNICKFLCIINLYKCIYREEIGSFN